jgi:hypothetical protein
MRAILNFRERNDVAGAIKNRFVVSRDDVNNDKLKDGNTLLSSENFINAPVELHVHLYLLYLRPLFYMVLLLPTRL